MPYDRASCNRRHPTMRIPFLSLLIPLLVANVSHGQEIRFADLGTCALESAEIIEECRIGYRTIGELNAQRDNAVLIPTWYGGTTEAWPDLQAQLLGENHDYFVVLVDAIGNGVSISPSNSDVQPMDAFPRFTTRDMVRSQYRLATEELGLERLHAVMGISMGGMQTFEWGMLYPEFMDKLVPIAGSPDLAGHDVALWETYKRLLQWSVSCDCDEAAEALAAIRLMNSTTSDQAGADMPGETALGRIEAAASNRIDAGIATNLIWQADAMMATDVTQAFEGDWAAAAEAVQAKVLIIVGSSDHVVTPGPAEAFAEYLGAKARLIIFNNDCGHDIPGCEMFRSRSLIREFLAERD